MANTYPTPVNYAEGVAQYKVLVSVAANGTLPVATFNAQGTQGRFVVTRLVAHDPVAPTTLAAVTLAFQSVAVPAAGSVLPATALTGFTATAATAISLNPGAAATPAAILPPGDTLTVTVANSVTGGSVLIDVIGYYTA